MLDIGPGDATLIVENKSIADRLDVALVPIDAVNDPEGDQGRVDSQKTVVLRAFVGLYDFMLVDTAGGGCLIRQFAFAAGDQRRAEIFDRDLVDCTEPPIDPQFPDAPWAR